MHEGKKQAEEACSAIRTNVAKEWEDSNKEEKRELPRVSVASELGKGDILEASGGQDVSDFLHRMLIA